MSWPAVHRWLARIRGCDPSPLVPHLSPQGSRAALDAALDALTPEALAPVAALPGTGHPRAVFVAARTVFTAPLEWCAVLLGRGSQVVLKHPAAYPSMAPRWAELAREEQLPLRATPDRHVVGDADLVVVMGSDPTVEALRATLGDRVVGFGHRFSVAYVENLASLDAVALDAALHDGVGCMSPVAVFTPHPLEVAVPALGAAMQRAQAVLPRGPLAPAEGAAIRQRRALARTTGHTAEGPDWAVHGLALERFQPLALPRCLAVHTVPDLGAIREALAPHRHALSTLGTDRDDLAALGLDPRQIRLCAPGEMQRPPLMRRHDGVDWVRIAAGLAS
ncbi:MAG: hypothetical protein KTR31_38410 [Myxococcales bacterium]|nr:hypothetical protein [Myxococcales bacterium]